MFERGFWCFALLTAYACLALSGPAMAQVPITDAECEMLEDKVDDDCDGLIEIYTLSDLNNMRYNLAGTSSETSNVMTDNDNGCPSSGCNGYELMNDLNFDTNGDDRIDEDDGPLSCGEVVEEECKGWEPIGTGGTGGSRFTATFDGNGHAIANLFIKRDSANYGGLFGALGSAGEIRNLGVVDATVSGADAVGGLVGLNDGGTITASHALATVSGGDNVGGLVGLNSGGTISASYAVATVMGVGDNGRVGGLVGSGSGTITASYALATVSGFANVGGLVGDNGAEIIASYAVATVTSDSNSAGGLVGNNFSFGIISESYALATVSGSSSVGGLVGSSSGTVRASYALATVSEGSFVGGLVGNNRGAISASYALATVSGSDADADAVGGLAGWNGGTVRASYALATVTGTSRVGGLIGAGLGSGATPDGSYFDATFAGATSLSDLVSSRTTSQLQTPTDYTDDDSDTVDIYATWNVDVDDDPGEDDPWNFGSNMQYPALALSPLATGRCPSAISPAVMIEQVEGECVHRPVSRFASVELDDELRRFDGILFTSNDNPRITGQLLLPEGSMVRLVSELPDVSTQTAADGRFTLTIDLTEAEEGHYVFATFATLPGTTAEIGPLGTLAITLDTTSPTLTVFENTATNQFHANVADANLRTIQYEELDHASSPTCVAGFSGGSGLKDYDPNPANADDRFLDALESDDDGNVGVYCFVAEDAAGNRAVASSADAIDFIGALSPRLLFANHDNPRITGQLMLPDVLLPVGSTVRLVSEMAEVSTQTDADGRFTLAVQLATEGRNVFEASVVRPPGGPENTVSLGELAIILDTMSPALIVRTRGDRFYATVEDDNPAPTIQYDVLVASDACTQEHFSGRDLTGLTPYDPNPANADDRFLPALEPDSEGNVRVYCFVAEDAAGNRAVFSSANAVPSALRLRLRVFLESALP